MAIVQNSSANSTLPLDLVDYHARSIAELRDQLKFGLIPKDEHTELTIKLNAECEEEDPSLYAAAFERSKLYGLRRDGKGWMFKPNYKNAEYFNEV